MLVYERRSHLPASPKEVFSWHGRPYAFDRVMPPWEETRLPFPFWRHTHRLEPAPDGGCIVIDLVECELPGGRLGKWLGERHARRRLDVMFAHRHEILRRDFSQPFPAPLRIAVTGASGLIGSALVPLLSTQGHEVVKISRKPDGEFDFADLKGSDVVVHLAGESITGRWNTEKKARILESRIRGTTSIVRALSALDKPPASFLCASAIGFYGDRGEAELTERSVAGNGFLPDVCRRWEEAAATVPKGVRAVFLRFGMVLSPRGGALKRMLLPARFGLAGPFGPGNQFTSWVSIEDAVGLIHHAIRNETIRGPMNIVSPNPLTNRDFTRTLCGVLGRPMNLSVPAPLLRLLAGDLAGALLLSSLRVVPGKALESGYVFRHAELKEALGSLLG